jgi:hypothetical protein
MYNTGDKGAASLEGKEDVGRGANFEEAVVFVCSGKLEYFAAFHATCRNL